MTPHKVKCIPGSNGEPYGRYVNAFKDYRVNDNKIVVPNMFPFPSGTMGKTYERDEVEVEFQYRPKGTDIPFIRCNDDNWEKEVPRSFDTRTIFCILPQPVEKEPKTVEQTHTPTLEDTEAYELGRLHESKGILDYIEKWQGQINSDLGLLLDRKFHDWQKQQSK